MTLETTTWTGGRRLDFKSLNTFAVGEAMVELAPVGAGQYRRGFAGDTFNTAWHMTQAAGAPLAADAPGQLFEVSARK